MKKHLTQLFAAFSLNALLISSFSVLLHPSALHAQLPNYVPTNGLVGWWPFNGNANDESGNGNNGTVNGATLTADRFGILNASYSFNGSNILIPLTQQMVSMPARTISLWFNSTTGQSGGRLFEATNYSWGTSCNTSNQFDCWYQKSNQAYNFVGESFQSNNQWHNLVFVCDSSAQSKKLYLNGTLINSGIPVSNPGSPISWQNHFLKIGQGNANESFIGSIDDIGIWDRALTACEVAELYTGQMNISTTSAGPDQTICKGEAAVLNGSGAVSYVWNNNVIDGQAFVPTSTAEYIVTGTDANGCIGTDTVLVLVNEATSSTQTQTALDSYTWPVNGQTYIQSGQYTDTLVNAAGCDSIITLDLTLSFTGIEDLYLQGTKKLIKITDLNGKETPFRKNTVLLFIYEDGTVERVYEGE